MPPCNSFISAFMRSCPYSINLPDRPLPNPTHTVQRFLSSSTTLRSPESSKPSSSTPSSQSGIREYFYHIDVHGY
ncbi:hypothetical protein HDU76_012028, partial [Blyttiomyces sp. JEL0837]